MLAGDDLQMGGRLRIDVLERDDPIVLEQLFADLEEPFREYSGLSDDDFPEFGGLDDKGEGESGREDDYQEFHLLFLPEEANVFHAALDKIIKRDTGRTFVGRYSEFEHVFDAVVRAKKVLTIHSVPGALLRMAELAMAQLDQEAAQVAMKKARTE